MRHTRTAGVSAARATVAALVTIALLAGSVDAAITRNLSLTHYRQYSTNACVAAATYMELKQVGVASPPTQSSLYNEGLGLKSCNRGVDNGLDPRAWAYLLYYHTPANRYYDHFKYTSAYAGTDAMVWQIFYYGEVAGALVNTGHHAMVFKGATVSCDPRDIDCNETISTVYVDDPWWDRDQNSPGSATCVGDDGQNYTCGKIGLAPGTAISYSMWTSYYYTKWSHQDCATWNNKWVAVLRKIGGGAPSGADAAGDSAAKDPADAPSDTGVMGRNRTEPAKPAPRVFAGAESPNAVDAAFQAARTTHGLNARADLAPALDGRVRSVVRVRSLDPAFPDYLLATVRGAGGARGVALFMLRDGRIEFGAFAPADEPMPKFPSVSSAEARRFVGATGVDVIGTPELVWRQSTESGSPFLPFYLVMTDNGVRYVTSGGEVIHKLTSS